MKKRNKIILIILSCSLIASIVLYITESQYGLFSRIYWGDRITVTIEGTYDGESDQPDSAQVECTGDEGRQEVHHNDSNKYSVRANEYGEYIFTFPVKHQIVQLKLVHTNWWSIDHYQLQYEVDTTSGIMSYTLTCNKADTESGTVYLNENKYSIYFMD